VAEAEGEGEDEMLLKELQGEEEPKAIAPMGIDPEDNPLKFRLVEDLPQYPGGAVEFMKWLTKNLQYPKLAQVKKTQGKVIAHFYVEKDGSITGLKIVQSLSRECDKEALRVLGMMPNWQPGVQNGQPCRTKVSIPIVFKL
jgi:protein TonB